MSLSPARLSALLFAAALFGSFAGCPSGECTSQGECAANEYCTPEMT